MLVFGNVGFQSLQVSDVPQAMNQITVKNQKKIEQDGQAHPDNGPGEGFPEADDMGVPPDDLQVKEKNAQDEDQEQDKKDAFCRGMHAKFDCPQN